MNDRFFLLSEEKQQAILNAGYRVFSENAYRNSPVSEIAAEAGISKSLLFHYFHNKKEFYFYLWENSAQVTTRLLTEYGCYETGGFFDLMEKGMKAKLAVMRLYPHLAAFTIKAYYEKDPEVQPMIRKSYDRYLRQKAETTMTHLDTSVFNPDIDLAMMYREMYLASEGYLWELVQKGPVNTDELEKGFSDLIRFWKKLYLRKE